MTEKTAVPVLWEPSPERVAASRMRAFQEWLAARGGPAPGSYAELHAWSVDRREDFWGSLWEFCGVLGEPGGEVLRDREAMPGAKWFPEARLNFAENLLRPDFEGAALVFRGEDGRRVEWSRAELRLLVGRLQALLREAGVGPGDRVAAFLPNVPEAVAAMLATASLGAVWSSCSPDFGAAGVLDRFGQIEPKVFLAVDGYFYKGRVHDGLDKVRQVREGLPTVGRTVVLRFTGHREDLAGIPGAVWWEDWLTGAPEREPDFPLFSFDHPLYILFSSGTTGKPKCIVHGAGGTLLQHLKEHRLHTDVRPGTRLFYFTTLGWMMWNWLVSGLASGAVLLLYDGNPFHPGPEALWDFARDEDMEVFGTSAKYLDAVKKSGLRPGESHDLSALRAICSTGSPLVAETFDWVYEAVKRDLLLASISGGTDIVSCFVLGCPILPVYRGEIQCRGLGMQVEVFDEEGRSVVGRPGELVCTAPFPSMPVGFWRDPDGRRYRSAYFERFPGVWCHGDWAELTPRGGMIIYGRSDATLNPGGVRIGTAEIYRQVELFEEVEEAVVVGRDTGDGDQRVCLFLRLRPGVELDAGLASRIRRRIRENTSPRHVPAVIRAVQDIPRTRSGKISEIAVREVIHGRPVRNTEALANPEALEEYRRLDLEPDQP